MMNMNKELLYALAPAGSTHTCGDNYRRYDKESDKWFFLSLEFKEWAPVQFPSPERYLPIPERELAINLVADKYSEWPKPDKFYTLYTQYQITWSEWSSRRDLRIEHGLIATLTDKGAKDVNDTESQWMPEVGEICEAYNFSLDIWLKAKTLDAKTESTPETAFVAINPDGACRMLFWSHKFRPIKTEREIFVESVVEKLIELDSDNWAHDANFIYDWLVGKGVDLSPLMESKDHE
jgi:hypothetical protein